MTCQTNSELELDNRARVVESSCWKCFTIYDREMYVEAPDKTPNVDVLNLIFDLIIRAFNSGWKIMKVSANAAVSHSPKDELSIQRPCIPT